jgi:hypothetical protein
MFTSHRYLLLAALVMGLAAAQVHAQQGNRGVYRGLPPGYPSQRPLRNPTGVFANPQIAPGLSLQQAAYNVAVMGNAYAQVPPYALGYNPYVAGPVLATTPGIVNPYALSTGTGYNPSMGGGSLSTSPYSLSTGGGDAFTPSYGYGGYGYQDPLGAQLQGYASQINATGKYYKDIQQAALTREQVRQAHLDTLRRRREYELWYESTRLKPHQLREREMALALNSARGEAPEQNVSSGQALNTLLASIQKSGKLSAGPNVPLDEDTLKHINLTSDGTVGNVGMLKDVSKLSWPTVLMEPNYDDARKRLNRNLAVAVSSLKEGDPVPDNTLKDVRADFKSINDRFSDSADNLTPSEYIDARRFLNQLNQAVRALGDRNVVKFFSNKNWTPQGKNVAELVSQLTKEGLSFGPATPSDQPAYKALYLAMRQFEAGLASAQAMK